MGTGKGPGDKPGRADALTVSRLFRNRQESSRRKRGQHQSVEQKPERAKDQRGQREGWEEHEGWGVLSTLSCPRPPEGTAGLVPVSYHQPLSPQSSQGSGCDGSDLSLCAVGLGTIRQWLSTRVPAASVTTSHNASGTFCPHQQEGAQATPASPAVTKAVTARWPPALAGGALVFDESEEGRQSRWSANGPADSACPQWGLRKAAPS